MKFKIRVLKYTNLVVCFSGSLSLSLKSCTERPRFCKKRFKIFVRVSEREREKERKKEERKKERKKERNVFHIDRE